VSCFNNDINSLNTDSIQLFLQLMHNSCIARNTINSLTVQPAIFNVENAHFHEKRNMLQQNKTAIKHTVLRCWVPYSPQWVTHISGLQFNRSECTHSNEGIWTTSYTWFLGLIKLITQIASRSVQPILHSSRHRVPILYWLPSDIRSCHTLHTFKKHLKTHLFRQS